MAPFPPVTLVGDNLGQRHRHLNSLVREATQSGASFQEVEALPEESAVDRLFKIDLAIELKHVNYIIRNLKDDDMLYVSRALKATWLIDHRDIINPKYLEDVLFPEMIKPAVTKMKHWLYINLRDPAMCEEFYQQYKNNTFEFSIKFLDHCSHEFILEEAPKILTKLSTHSLKVLCEKCPGVAKIYFDSLAKDEVVKKRYLENEHNYNLKQKQSYYNSVKCVLKLDADVFLDITEKYFNINRFSRLSPLATDYILRYHKTRFTNKLELYVAYFLHIPTVAARLSVEECQEVVLKLARASYLQHWFQYKVVEPLIKRLSPDKRAAFKKRVFVDKDVGICVDKWPYEIPAPPVRSDTGPHIFDDQDFMSNICYPIIPPPIITVPSGCGLYSTYECLPYKMEMNTIRKKTDLDRLFDEFRFIGFERALFELGHRLNATSSPDRRRDIFMVLVSKTGGRPDAVSALLCLAARHSNEPPHIRAAVLRSLVKRAKVWRLPSDVWQQLLDYGHGLGLDGAKVEAPCREGLHAVVIRQLLAGECEQAVRIAFMRRFSTLKQYSLNVDERKRVADGLQNMLVTAAVDATPALGIIRISQLLVVRHIYRIRIDPTALKILMELTQKHADLARPLLEWLYYKRIARRELLQHNLKYLRRDEAALLNVLQHEPKLVLDIMADSNRASSAAELTDVDSSSDESTPFDNLSDQLSDFSCDLSFPICYTPRPLNFDRFTSKLVIYFEDLTSQLRNVLKECHPKQIKLARLLASLSGNNFENELRDIDAAGKKSKKVAAGLRACAVRARPAVNLAEWGWRKAGVKAVATRAMRCREIERAAFIRALAAEKRTVRVALALSMRSTGPRELLLETFATAAKLRPVVALHTALPYFRRLGANADPGVWDIIKPLFSSVDLVPRERLRRLLANTDWIPSTIKPDYCATLYVAINKIACSDADDVLCNLSKLLPYTDGSIVNIILLEILNRHNTDKNSPAIHYPAIFIRYLMLSTSTDDLESRFELIGNQFLQVMETLHSEKDQWFQERLDQLLRSLKYNAAFFNSRYTSCSSVIERILTWLQKFMPKETCFKYYAQVRLTMLYYRAVRQSMKQMPEIFADPKRRKSEGVEAVGFMFGRYIVQEVAELVNTYFDSIIELYTSILIDYLRNYFVFENSKPVFIGAVLKGMWEEGIGIQRRMVVYVFTEQWMNMEDGDRGELKKLMMNEKALEIFVHAEILT